MITKSPTSISTRAFSLIELLVVITIIATVAVFIAPAASSMLKGTDLTQAGQIINDQIGLARQESLSRNHPIEVRFYRFRDPEIVGETGSGSYRGIQRFEIADTGEATPRGRMVRLPDSIIIDSGSQLSTLISDGATDKSWSGLDTQIPIPRVGTSYKCNFFRFRPDGSTTLLSSKKWYLTAHEAQFGDSLGKPPHNFFTVQIDPSNGNARNFRP